MSVIDADAVRGGRLPVFALLAWMACSGPGGPLRVLDSACASHACPISGAARYTSGIAPGSQGLVLGPGEGSVQIFLGTIPYDVSSWSVDILASGSGSVQANSPPGSATTSGNTALPSDYQWVTVQGGGPPCEQPEASAACSAGVPLTMQIATTDATSVAHVADVRLTLSFGADNGCE
jgi:hypothetical protein